MNSVEASVYTLQHIGLLNEIVILEIRGWKLSMGYRSFKKNDSIKCCWMFPCTGFQMPARRMDESSQVKQQEYTPTHVPCTAGGNTSEKGGCSLLLPKDFYIFPIVIGLCRGVTAQLNCSAHCFSMKEGRISLQSACWLSRCFLEISHFVPGVAEV